MAPRFGDLSGTAAVSKADDARIWVRILAGYREPSLTRSLFELAVTGLPFIALWAAAWASLSVSVWLAVFLALVNALFLVRLFMIQHDCGHGSFFRNRRVSDWVGRVIGVLTLTPYDFWKRAHALHHASAGNLDRRGIGDVTTLTVAEYRALSLPRRVAYRLYRNPVVMFGLGPIWLFLIQHRLPMGLMRSGPQVWISAMGTNLAVAAMLGATIWAAGPAPVLLIWLPTTIGAASIGVWLFYVQHQFEDTTWENEPDWQIHDAAAHGSSYYVLPGPLRWLTANIGMHHVHHLQSRVPFYRLPEVLRDHPRLAEVQRLTLRESFACVHLKLWDAERGRLVSFRDAGV
ncbi:fatty acid desaturase [Sulfitobacter sp. LCG007]